MLSFPFPGGMRVTVNVPDRAALLAEVARRLDARRGFVLATLNLDHLVKLRGDAAFRSAYAAADLVTADGRPILLLARLAGGRLGLAPGSELIDPLCALAAARQAPVAFFGGAQETLDAAAEALARLHPGLNVAARLAPPYGFDPQGPAADAFIERLAAAEPRLCFLALGAPKQEIFAARAAARLPECGFASIGAGLDFIAGAQRRAPVWMRRVGLEWVWRMLSNPRRLVGRYARCAAIMPALAAAALRGRLSRRGPED